MPAVTLASPPKRSLFKPSLDWLLVFVPVAIALKFLGSSPTWLFIFACLAVIPLAGWMGRATEHLAEKVGEGIGGLLNATFGNAAELIIALIALQKGLDGVVKASITGSIIGNVLLVLGLSLFCGGLKYRTQRFNRTVARSSATTLLLAAIALVMPTIFHKVADEAGRWTIQTEQRLSLAISVVLFITYIATLLFSLKTHKELFSGQSEADAQAEANAAEVEDVVTEPHNEHEEWSMKRSIVTLLISTFFVAWMSELLVGSVEAARSSLGLTEVFVGVIVVAIIGNAAEHSTAVMSALKNKNDLAVGIAIGSSIQIALFVAPVLVFASYLFGKPLDLEFSLAETAAVVVAVGISAQIAGDGESNWLEGAQLLAVYAILGILFFFLPEIHVGPATTTH
ncbi:Ca(2+)/H(+) antiporter [Abditibacteriota bacterium]|nr:Ca(2+)/H(+) antiporter [Abditibacteriota bacterium]